MLSRFVEEGSKVELRALEHGLGESGAENTTKVYQSRVLQILSEDTLEISMPMEQTRLILLPVESEYELLDYLEEASKMQNEYKKVLQAIDQVRQKGYGVVTPERSEIELEAPEVIRHGSKYGVKIKAKSPSIHMIRANIETEIAPIVGTKEQAEDLIGYIGQNEASDGIWDTNIFGKTVEQMVQDGITTKIAMIGEESQLKLQDSMQKIVNDTNGGLVCIII